MGVQIYLLDRRMTTVFVETSTHKIGTLRSFWKVSEINEERAAEVRAIEAGLQEKAAPAAVMIAEVAKLPLAASPSKAIAVHLVLGWDEDRASVTDFTWDYLPILGYAVKKNGSTSYLLHEERNGLLYPMSENRAGELEILDANGKLIRRGQPSIIECRTVKPYISFYAEAACLLSDGREVEILTSVEPGNLPAPAWYMGKRPTDVSHYQAGN